MCGGNSDGSFLLSLPISRDLVNKKGRRCVGVGVCMCVLARLGMGVDTIHACLAPLLGAYMRCKFLLHRFPTRQSMGPLQWMNTFMKYFKRVL